MTKEKRTQSVFCVLLPFICSFCSSWRRRRSWRLSPACPLSPWSFRLPRKPVCRLLWIRCFPCSLLWGIAPVFRLLPVEGSMSLRSRFYTFLVGELFPHTTFRRQAFISARSVRCVQRNINMLPSSDMGVLLGPLLRVPPKTIPPEGAPRF